MTFVIIHNDEPLCSEFDYDMGYIEKWWNNIGIC